MAQGLFNHEIASRLFLAGETVKTHIHHLLGKLGARSRTHAVAIALRQGLLEEDRLPARELAERAPSVPFVDLGPAHAGIAGAIVGDIVGLVGTGAFTNGSQVRQFEKAFAEYCGCANCVGVASGLDALRLALLAGGIEPGDEVIVPAYTFAATIEAVVQAGGEPVLVDVGERDYDLDPAAVEGALTTRTRWLLPVHLYGQMADMVALGQLADGTASGSSRTPARRTEHAATAVGRYDGPRRSVQLLPLQEPRRLRGRRRDRDGGRAARGARARPPRARPAADVRARGGRLHRATRHDPGSRAPPQAAAAGGLEPATAGGRRLLRPAPGGVGDLRLPPVPPEASRSGTSTSSAPRGRRRWPPSSESGRSARVATIRSRSTALRRSGGSATGRERSPSASGSQPRCSRCRCSPASARISWAPSSPRSPTTSRGTALRGEPDPAPTRQRSSCSIPSGRESHGYRRDS